MPERHTGNLKPPRVGDKWDRGEKLAGCTRQGERFVAVMGPTGFVLAWDVSTTKEGRDAVLCGSPGMWRSRVTARIQNI